MVDDFGEKLMHNNDRKLRKGGLNMAAFSRRMKFINVYDQLIVDADQIIHEMLTQSVTQW